LFNLSDVVVGPSGTHTAATTCNNPIVVSYESGVESGQNLFLCVGEGESLGDPNPRLEWMIVGVSWRCDGKQGG